MQLAASRGAAHGGSERRCVGVVVAEIVGIDVVLAGFLAPLQLLRSIAVRACCDAFGLSQGYGRCYRLLDLRLLFSRNEKRPRA